MNIENEMTLLYDVVPIVQKACGVCDYLHPNNIPYPFQMMTCMPNVVSCSALVHTAKLYYNVLNNIHCN